MHPEGTRPNNIKAKGNRWKQAIDWTPSWTTDRLLTAHLTRGGLCQSRRGGFCLVFLFLGVNDKHNGRMT